VNRARFRVLALCLVLALVAGGCGGGSGDPEGGKPAGNGPWFRSERPPTSMSDTQGEATALWLGKTGAVECGKAIYTALLRGKAERLLMHVAFSECEIGGEAVGVDTAGCAYVFEAAPRGKQTPVPISCRDGGSIDISLPTGCTLEVGSQTPKGGSSYSSTGRGSSRTFDALGELSGVAYESSGGSGCEGVGNGKDISISYGIEMYGTEQGSTSQAGLWIE
jgi:hypothetical protein